MQEPCYLYMQLQTLACAPCDLFVPLDYRCACSGGKLGLSMRDVDQATGRDLLDLDKIRAAQVSICSWRPGQAWACAYYMQQILQHQPEDALLQMSKQSAHLHR